MSTTIPYKEYKLTAPPEVWEPNAVFYILQNDVVTVYVTDVDGVPKLQDLGGGDQVNADWNAVSGVAEILNKPTIPAAQVNSDWDAVSGVTEILNKPTIPEAQVNSDWDAVSGLAEILNKPTITAGTTDVVQVALTKGSNNDYTGTAAGFTVGTAVVYFFSFDVVPSGGTAIRVNLNSTSYITFKKPNTVGNLAATAIKVAAPGLYEFAYTGTVFVPEVKVNITETGMSNPMTTTGDTIYSLDNNGEPQRLGIGATDQVLTVVAGLPAWADATGGASGTDLGWLNVKDFDAKGDGVIISDANITSGSANLTTTTTNFLLSDVGKHIQIQAGGASGFAKVFTITAFINANSVTLNTTAGASVTNGIAKYGTDDTAAIQAAIGAGEAIYTATLYFPIGIYIIAGALQSPSNSQLVLPTVANPDTYSEHSVFITFKGESRSAFDPTILYTTIPPDIGTTLLSFGVGSGSFPSVIGADTTNGLTNTYCDFYIENMNIQVMGNTPTGAALGGINAGQNINFIFNGITVMVDVPLIDSVLPTSNYAGIICPHTGLGGIVYGENSQVCGFRFGIIHGEHFTSNNVQVFVNYVGVNPTYAVHSSHFTRLLAQWNVYHIGVLINYPDYVSLFPHVINIDEFDVENCTDAKWFETLATINDPNNILYGNVNYHPVTEVTGPDYPSFLKIGGTNLQCNPLQDGLSGIGTYNRFKNINSFNKGMLFNQTGSGAQNNIIYVGSESSGAVNNSLTIAGMGAGSAVGPSNGPYLAMRGNTYSTAQQRGSIVIGAGNPSTPLSGEGAITFYSGADIQRLRITNSGHISIGTSDAMYWDNTNNRLGIGVSTTPANKLDILASASGHGGATIQIKNSNAAGDAVIQAMNSANGGFVMQVTGSSYALVNKGFLFTQGTVDDINFLTNGDVASGGAGGINFITGGYNNTAAMTISSASKIGFLNTVTAGGTTGNQTINKPSGTVNFATGTSTLTVTNSLCTTSSIVFAVVRTNDAAAIIKNVVPGSGSFVITLNAATGAETSVGFFIIN